MWIATNEVAGESKVKRFDVWSWSGSSLFLRCQNTETLTFNLLDLLWRELDLNSLDILMQVLHSSEPHSDLNTVVAYLDFTSANDREDIWSFVHDVGEGNGGWALQAMLLGDLGKHE